MGTRHYRPRRKSFTTLRPSSLTRHGWIRVSPLSKIPTAASRRSLGRVSVPVWLVALKPATDRSLGEPLPHQQANQTRANLSAINLSPEGACSISAVSCVILHRKACSHVLLTRPPLPLLGARLACVKPAASVRPVPGSNPPVMILSTSRRAHVRCSQNYSFDEV